MSGHKPWREIKHKRSPEDLRRARQIINNTLPWHVRLRWALQEFFTPRDWIPTFPIPRKPDPQAQGYQSLYEALRGFKKEN